MSDNSEKLEEFEDEPVVLDTTPKADPKPRLTVVETVYHQIPGESPSEFSCKFSQEIESDEQPYQRKKKIGEKWEPLDLNWLKDDCGMVCICNEAKVNQRGQTEEEKEAISKQIIQIGFRVNPDYPDLEVFPGESVRFRPYAPHFVCLRCQSGKVRYSLFIVPR